LFQICLLKNLDKLILINLLILVMYLKIKKNKLITYIYINYKFQINQMT
jgi:hypothetical protein